MRRLLTRKWVLIVALAAFSCAAAFGAPETSPPPNEAAKLLPNKLGDFQARSPTTNVTVVAPGELTPAAFDITARAGRDYFSRDGRRFAVSVATTRADPSAYSLLTYLMRSASSTEKVEPLAIGTAAARVGGTIYFFRGSAFVIVSASDLSTASLDQELALARAVASSLDGGEGDIPVLVKHLPDWHDAKPKYAVSLQALNAYLPGHPILNELNFDGGTEAVIANYGPSQLVIVEFTTPQFASDNDRRITAKIQELKTQGQAVPTAYRRVGNYSVFVFNAPDEKTANALIDQVKYEQVVQWLGDDPHLYERVQRYVLQKTGGVVVAVLESSGLSVLLCLGVGGLFGALLFRRRRRARQRQGEAYSDAGGMVRLNLDEGVESDAARLLQEKHD